MTTDDVKFRGIGALGRITLNRPAALNTLTLPMCAAIYEKLREWAEDDVIRSIVIDAVPGRAFCAGGDIRAIVDSAKAEDGLAARFFTTEYRLNAAIKNYPKPYVALIDGYAFGGGLGVTVHGSHRIVGENAVLAMPETAIGFFPDIGASHFLSRLPGKIGLYLALTGLRLNAADAVYAGLATHFVPAARFSLLLDRLAGGERPDRILADLAADPGPPPLARHRAAIDRSFTADSVEGILERLAGEGEWGAEIARVLRTRCPESLKLTCLLMRETAGRALEDCLRTEYRLALRLSGSHNFDTGVRAALIEKNPAPAWEPSTLDAVKDQEIRAYFASLGTNELML
jgi:enoyl-CoA hydratase